MNRIYWVSRHHLLPEQLKVIYDLHGKNVEIIQESVVFEDYTGLARYICEHSDGFVYAVAGISHYLYAALSGYEFGIFEHRKKGEILHLVAVYHVKKGKLYRVWSKSLDSNNIFYRKLYR